MIKHIENNRIMAFILSLLSVCIAGFMQAFVIQTFVQPAELLSSGFTGIAILINKIAYTFFNLELSVSMLLVLLNLPVVILCYKAISKRFVFFSLITIAVNSFCLSYCDFPSLFETNDQILNVVFGGLLSGFSVAIALKGRASSGGTDFIALYISNKKGRSIWNEIFVFNIFILVIFGYLFGWSSAGYSIIFQYISTKTISTLHQRYQRVTLQMTTSKEKSEELVEAYITNFKHGLSCVEAIGGYSKRNVTIITTVVSSYEVQDIIDVMLSVDPYVIINTFKTQEFHGRFYQKPID
ncbi:MAG: YitT family protein [bacterium]